jgi:hypothetical protein
MLPHVRTICRLFVCLSCLCSGRLFTLSEAKG